MKLFPAKVTGVRFLVAVTVVPEAYRVRNWVQG
jgi:hypothetical protein